MTGGADGHSATPTPTPRSINPADSDLSTQTARPLIQRNIEAGRSVPPLALPTLTDSNPIQPPTSATGSSATAAPIPSFAMSPPSAAYDPAQMMMPMSYGNGQMQMPMPMPMQMQMQMGYGDGQMQMPMQIPPMYVPYSPWAATNAVAPAMDGMASPTYGGQDAYGNHVFIINAPQETHTPRERKSALDEPIWPGLIYLLGCLFGPCFWISGVYWWNSKDSRSRFLGRLNVVSFIAILIVIIIAMIIRNS